MQYQLNISIDQPGCQQIYKANQAITIVKSVVANPLASGNLPVAWINFQPLEENSVIWVENYNIYATTTSLTAGATIVQTSVTGAPVQTAGSTPSRGRVHRRFRRRRRHLQHAK